MIQAILHYQEIDKKLYKLERDLAGSDERKEYVKVKKFLETAPEKLEALEAKAVSLKGEAGELSRRYQQTEETLKDFEHLDELVEGGADISFYKKKAQSINEQLKKLKGDMNVLSESIKAVDGEYQKLKKQILAIEKQAPEISKKYKAAKAAVDAQREEIEKELSVIVKDIPENVLTIYKTKRKEKIFPVVGELTGNRCPYCSMEPPLAARNKLTGGAFIECDNCHSIIFSK